MSSMMPNPIWMSDIDESDLSLLKNRLLNGYEIPSTKDLIIMARNFCERGEYRSAVIKASASLEVAIEEK